MIRIHTLFDFDFHRPLPTVVGVKINDDIKIIKLYIKGSGKNLYDIDQNVEKIKKIIYSESDITLNDYKSHLLAYEIMPAASLSKENVFCNGSIKNETTKNIDKDVEIIKEELNKPLDEHKNWQQVLASSHVAYAHMEKTGFTNGVEVLHPRYSTETYSGRSSTSVHNIQGATEGDLVFPVERQNVIFIHFDWIAADVRMMAYMSGDSDMAQTFINSDPYTELSNMLGLDRGDVKVEFLRSIYSLDCDSDIIKIYPGFHKWFKSKVEELHDNGCLYSILDKKFEPREGNLKSVFSGILSGSIAHGMQNTLYNVFNIFPEYLMTEVHDSIVATSEKSMVMPVINEVTNVMTRPFAGLELKTEQPFFPVKVSIGTEWKKWKGFKEYREA